MPEDWETWGDQRHTEVEVAAIRRNVSQGAPFVTEQWVTPTAAGLGLASATRPRGRPRKYLTQTSKTSCVPFSGG